MTEKQFQNKVIQFLQSQHAYVIKYWGGGQYTKAGVPDLLCCINGYFFGIELKTDTGKTSKLQDHHIEKILEAGGQAVVIRPRDFEGFKNWIEEVNALSCPKSNIPIRE